MENSLEPTTTTSDNADVNDVSDLSTSSTKATQFGLNEPPVSYADVAKKEPPSPSPPPPNESMQTKGGESLSMKGPGGKKLTERHGDNTNKNKGTVGNGQERQDEYERDQDYDDYRYGEGPGGGGGYLKKDGRVPEDIDYRKNGKIVTGVPGIPVTIIRKPFVPLEEKEERGSCDDRNSNKEEIYGERSRRRDSGYGGETYYGDNVKYHEKRLRHAGTPRANYAPSTESPQGTTHPAWVAKHAHQTVLQQHCAFFDRNEDGILWPQDTYIGFRRIGFSIPLSLFAMVIIHINFSYPTVRGILPDPFFRIYLDKVHKDKHGSDTGSYDTEGRFVPQKFEDFFSKYGRGGKEQGTEEGVTLSDVFQGWKAQRCVLDPIGWSAEVLEWLATYILLWPEDGVMRKEDVRKVYDGSIFYEVAERRERSKNVQKKKTRKESSLLSLSSIGYFIEQAQGVGKILEEQIAKKGLVGGSIGYARSIVGSVLSGVGSGRGSGRKRE